MKRINQFDEKTRFMFLEDNYWECWEDGKCHANCLHHIFGRGSREGPEKSPLNAAPLSNFDCHLPIHGRLMTVEGKKKMFLKTLNFLEKVGYSLTPLDNEFLEKYKVDINKLGLEL